jgi:signal transduction histidine kinase
MDRFGRGELDSRAEESGPGELREMTRQFNVMADTLVAQRGHQMSTLAGVAHDVLTPLTSIKLSMGRLPAGQPLPPEARLRRIIDNVQRQAERIERMMRDLVDTAGIDNGGLELQLETCDGREVIREACDLIGLDQAEGRLEMHLPAAPVSLYCDRHRMERVLANLVGNALKYSPHASPVRVAIAVRDHEVVISIADQGIGISAEDREKLFRPFRRLEPGRQRSRGTGLGLFVARSIVEAHAGRIDIDSTPGEGSTFRIHLPPGRNGPA